MNYDSDDNINENDPIIGFKKSHNKTSTEYRANFALDASHLLALRTLCQHVSEDEFTETITILLLGVAQLLDEAKKQNETAMNNYQFDIDDSSGSSMSVLSGLQSLYNSDTSSEDLSMISLRDLHLDCSDSSDDGISFDYSYSDDDDSTVNTNSAAVFPEFIAPCNSYVSNLMIDMTTKFGFPVKFKDCFNIKHIGDYEDLLCFVSSMLSISIIDIDYVCRQIVDLSAIRASDWEQHITTRRGHKTYRTIDSFATDIESKSHTRFNKEELRRLLDLLFSRQPTSFYVWKTYRFTYEETLIIALDYMANGTKYQTMRHVYGGDWTTYGYCINFFARYLLQKYYHRLSGHSMDFWSPNVHEYRKAIWLKVCFDEEGSQDILVSFDEFAVFAWIDGMQNETCRPGGGPIDNDDNRRADENRIQRAFFTSYGKKHGMKTLAVYLPNGMIGSVYVCSISNNDKGAINLSGIESAVKNAFRNDRLADGFSYPKIFGDEIFDPSEVMCKCNGQNTPFFNRLSSTRGDNEHIFGLVSNLWKRSRVKHTWMIMEMKKTVKAHLFSIFFMTNLYSCIKGNKTSTKYGFRPFSLDEYLNVDASVGNDCYDLDEFMLDHIVY